MRKALAPLRFDDDDPAGTVAERSSPVQPARRSPAAHAKAAEKRTPNLPVHSFQTLLAGLATLTGNRVPPAVPGTVAADVLASPTPLHAEAFRLLKVRP